MAITGEIVDNKLDVSKQNVFVVAYNTKIIPVLAFKYLDGHLFSSVFDSKNPVRVQPGELPHGVQGGQLVQKTEKGYVRPDFAYYERFQVS